MAKRYCKMDTRGIVAQIARIREQTNLLIERELRDRSITGIVPAHGSVLNFLFQQSKPVPIKAVVEKVRRVKSTVTAVINTLQRHGYVRKTPCRIDNRVTYVELTTRGRRLHKDYDDISRLLLKRFYGDMNENDLAHLVWQLEQIEKNLRA
jgi:DNA-binding MarR family transcriptional regulator